MPWDKPYHPPRNQRLDSGIYALANQLCFITIRAYQGQAPFANERLNNIVLGTLRKQQNAKGCTVFTYCLMPDHLHFLIASMTDGASVLAFTEGVKGKTTNLSWGTGWRGKLWQPRYYDHIIRKDEDIRTMAQYILDNPVRKFLISSPEAWPWSGHMNPLPL